MSAGGKSQQNMRRAIGALKDSTTVGLKKVNSEKKGLQVAIVKATNHDEGLPKEKHVWTIFHSLSASSPRVDVAYCIDALHKRLSKTRSWIVALKTLIVIHRALREVDSSFHEELSQSSKGRLMLNLSHFRDDSTPHAWDYSAWVRTYSLYLEERLECFSALKYDVQKNHSRLRDLDTKMVLDKLPLMQQLLFRLLDCKPEGVVAHNNLIRYALSVVASESINLDVAITDGLVNLVDKYFEMEQHDAGRAIEIYKKASGQGEKLTEFFEMCRSLEFGQEQTYIQIKQPPASFLAAMEEYVAEAPHVLALEWVQVNNEEGATPKTVPAPQTILSMNHRHDETEAEVDLLGLDVITQETSENNQQIDAAVTGDDLLNMEAASENTSWELALVSTTSTNEPADVVSNNLGNVGSNTNPTSWELALVSAPSSNEPPQDKVGGLDISTLNSLYNTATAGGLNMSALDSLYNTATTGNQIAHKTINPFDSFKDSVDKSNCEQVNIQDNFPTEEQPIDPSNPFAISFHQDVPTFHDSNPSLI